ncbi:MAG: carbon storage regulator [Rubripirellula sp.]|jgi:carbon storage regulator CsrA|nr:carbon storage regulator [Rubripirellula sp.]
MLVLSRKIKEKLVIDGDIVITVQKIAGNRITLAIEAPKEVRVRRGELDKCPRSKQATFHLASPAAGSIPTDQTHVAIASRPLA